MTLPEKIGAYELQRPVEGESPGEFADEAHKGITTGTSEDAVDMHRLGRKQEFKRNFSSFSILGVTSVVMATWEALIGLINGGMAGTIWVYVGIFVCTLAVVASLADMASMAPTSAGQYAWVSEFGPPKYQRLLSYTVGWLSVLGWQAAIATTAYTSGVLILELTALNNPNYVPTQWQETLITWAVVAFATFFNTIGAKWLPLFEGIILFVHVAGFLGILIPLWVVAPKAPASEVFGSFSNFGGWSSVGAACVIGQLTATSALGGSDAAAHMSEEVKNASLVVPRVMMTTILLNGALGFVMIVTFVFCITDIETMIIDSTAVFPYIGVFYAATSSKAGATAMTALLAAMNFAACLSTLAAASRQAWSFGRDEGLPFSHWFRKASHLIATLGLPVPVNACLFSLSITVILSLLNLGSTAAFNSIVGLLSGSGGVAYTISIGCVLWKRLHGGELPIGRWSLGKLGVPVNAFAVCYLIFMTVMSFFPLFSLQSGALTLASMNWGSVMFAGVTGLAILYYFVYGRRFYKGPVVYINRD